MHRRIAGLDLTREGVCGYVWMGTRGVVSEYWKD